MLWAVFEAYSCNFLKCFAILFTLDTICFCKHSSWRCWLGKCIEFVVSSWICYSMQLSSLVTSHHSRKSSAEKWIRKVDKAEINTFSSWVLQKVIEGNLDLTSMHLHHGNELQRRYRDALWHEYRNLKLQSIRNSHLVAGRKIFPNFIRPLSFLPTASKNFAYTANELQWTSLDILSNTHIILN